MAASKKNSVNNQSSFKAWFPKIFSVVAAIILWFYVVDVQTTTEEATIYNVPVEIENFLSADGLDIISGKDHTIDVVVRGTRTDVISLTQNDIYASVDMSGIASAGNYKRDVNVKAPKGISVVSKTVSSITIGVDKTISKPVPVFVNAEYSIAEDIYEQGEPILSEDTVYVQGPEKLVDSVVKAEARVNLEHLESKVSARVALVPVDEAGNDVSSPYLKLKDSFVNVTIPVYKISTVKIEPVFYDVNYKYDYDLLPKTIRIKGDATTVDSIEKIFTQPITETEPRLVVTRFNLPEGITAYDDKGSVIDSVRVSIKSVEIIGGKAVEDEETSDVDADSVTETEALTDE